MGVVCFHNFHGPLTNPLSLYLRNPLLTYNSEPCIRGHRSSKCEHWDRFMVVVRKPGRPLSTCPHPKDECQCTSDRVMMVKMLKRMHIPMEELCV